jgi:hypothetical protein
MAKSQKELIRDYIKKHGSITQMDANFDLSITKLSTRISETRRNGENIVGEMEIGKNKWGETCRYMRYRMGDL